MSLNNKNQKDFSELPRFMKHFLNAQGNENAGRQNMRSLYKKWKKILSSKEPLKLYITGSDDNDRTFAEMDALFNLTQHTVISNWYKSYHRGRSYFSNNLGLTLRPYITEDRIRLELSKLLESDLVIAYSPLGERGLQEVTYAIAKGIPTIYSAHKEENLQFLILDGFLDDIKVYNKLHDSKSKIPNLTDDYSDSEKFKNSLLYHMWELINNYERDEETVTWEGGLLIRDRKRLYQILDIKTIY